MGYIKHHTIIVTGYSYPCDEIIEAYKKAHEIFSKYFEDELVGRLINEVTSGIANVQCSFFIAPDGSKEGWTLSDNTHICDADSARAEFVQWLNIKTL